ncbi:hypothetical protein MRX96_014806 [Rhipicephalus microplus]
MNCQLRSVVRELDLEKLNRRFPGLGLNVPCGVNDGGGGGEDGDSGPTSVCHVFDNLPQWNYVLWHVGLQLRELRVPGRLCLVHVFYRGGGGRPHRARSHLARILFRILLVQHNCVEGLHLDHSLIEGSGLGEYREFVVSALQKNVSLRTLTLGSLFCDYRSIREELFAAVAAMVNLGELVVSCSAAIRRSWWTWFVRFWWPPHV